MFGKMLDSESNLSKQFLRACQKGDLSQIRRLGSENIKDWSIIRHASSGDSPLHIAAREGNLEIVKSLCSDWKDQKCTIDVVNLEMKTALHEASQFSRTAVVEYLIEKGANLNSLKRADWTPLMLACTKRGSEANSCVQALLKANADLSIRNKDGWTAFHLACRSGDINIVNLLLKYSPECIEAGSKNGRNALHIAAFHGCKPLIDLLVSKNSKLLDSRDSSGSAPLHESVKSKCFEATKSLIESGANIAAVDDAGQNILHIAASVGNREIVEYILESNLIDIQSEAQFQITPLIAAERNSQHEIVKLLLKHEDKYKEI
ncbi:ankyrin repeat domain-containing protein 16-like [Belonocnema kinseyi]|uniref:ankyrin repeat domain-containing protein 16-like n=1 Tax=Belonocnema kinseyi TaxID=2817044 RepID=UPI00143D8AC3|nr:ankyrin repeat domain-containing protein 16-like [Belonocnema kinseyi]